MRIRDSARKHGVADDDIRHALAAPFRFLASDNPDVKLVIGVASNGALLELAVLDPDQDPVVIHAMPLRRRFYRYL